MKNIAVISGASSGMGKEFARILNGDNLDEIWAIGTKVANLQALKDELSTPVKVLVLDLTQSASFDTYAQELKKADVNILWLVNAAGYGIMGRYDEIPLNNTLNMIDLNVKGLVNMTELSLPYMRKGARIVQIASIAAYQPVPYMAAYGATKSFVLSYSRAINMELKTQGISVTTVCPYWTNTNFISRAQQNKQDVITKYPVIYQPEKVIARAYNDAIKRKPVSMYGFVARSQTALVKHLPVGFVLHVWDKQQKFSKRYKQKINASK